MKPVTIYTKPFCPYCSRALSVLKKKGVEVTEIEAGFDADLRREMIQRSGGGSTYPQIFIGETHVGGCDDMMALDYSGELDKLLNA
jgi:glutaredoxin 3